ncbi:hypothetical protein [Porphyromonas gulae]|uniref:hypothetical protein n=1 Tax=Porphyromonas gulae TaxID=111105 RepID=UPI00126A58DF|nr:hypothetical protein [Porphyromonas gulae]
MNKEQKILWLKKMHTMAWMQTWNDAFDELSSMQTVFCVCGKVASGLHERSCAAFRKKVDDAAIKRLEHLMDDTR